MRMLPKLAAIALFLLPATASSQPSLASLWPNADGLRWDYQMTAQSTVDSSGNFTETAILALAGTVETTGGTAQVLVATHDFPLPANARARDPILRAVWRARPDLRRAIEARYGKPSTEASGWWPLLLHGGYFMKTAANIQMWQPDVDHPTWTYLRDDLTVGATFTHHLIPDLAPDVYLYGTVEAIDATVTTLAGTFEHAVRMGYRIDYGWSVGVDANQIEIGMFRSETRGHVHYVAEVGPVELLEDFLRFVEVDCSPSACPQEWIDQLGVTQATLTLSLSRMPVAVVAKSWSQIKALYQD